MNMKRNIAAWKILALPADVDGRPIELEGVLTLGSGTHSPMPTVVLWWAKPGLKRYQVGKRSISRST